jgi:hypothetical protein
LQALPGQKKEEETEMKPNKTLIKLVGFTLGLALILTSDSNYAASSATASGVTATTTIVASIGITKTADLAFGNRAEGDGTVTVGVGDSGAASFDVSGANSTAFTITLPTSTTMTGPGTAITVNNFAHDAGGTPTLSGAGALTFAVGADAVINATQTSGSYSGTFNVTVAY